MVVYQFIGDGYSYAVHNYWDWRYESDVGVGFINASSQPIKALTFVLTYVSHDHPVLESSGKPFESRLVANGPFLPGSSRAVIGRASWPGKVPPISFACPKLAGIEVAYQDGSTVTVPADQVSRYSVSDLNIDCAFANIHRSPNIPNVANGSTPYTIPWMVTYQPTPNPYSSGASTGRGRG